MKQLLKTIPLVGPVGARFARRLRGAVRVLRGKNSWRFERINVNANRGELQIANLLNYTKASGSSYAGTEFPAGYHTIQVGRLNVRGKRDPQARLSLVPMDFSGKTVLDIGCNQGGMLFSVADKIAHGVGIDFDPRMVNAANKIRSHLGLTNIEFYVFDLEKENLNLIQDFLPREKVDVVFLLSVCMWISNWRDVIDLTTHISDALLFESNGAPHLQVEQVEYLRTRYNNVVQLTNQSDDDPGQKMRRLYFCS